MELEGYLNRIGLTGPLEPTLATLTAIHRAHLLSISYENLDIHLGRRLDLDRGRIFDKLVNHRRGGWCYEMNGLLSWALERVGFDVTLVAGAVRQDGLGKDAEGNHLVLIVRLDRPYVVDVGFGDGFLEPLPLEEGTYAQGWLEFRLERSGDRWVVHNHQYGTAQKFDFTLEPKQLDDFAARCHELQTSPASGFVRKTVCQRITPDGIVTLRGAILQRVTVGGVAERTVDGPADYAELLDRVFGLAIPEVGQLWDRVWSRHLAWTAAMQRTP